MYAHYVVVVSRQVSCGLVMDIHNNLIKTSLTCSCSLIKIILALITSGLLNTNVTRLSGLSMVVEYQNGYMVRLEDCSMTFSHRVFDFTVPWVWGFSWL